MPIPQTDTANPFKASRHRAKLAAGQHRQPLRVGQNTAKCLGFLAFTASRAWHILGNVQKQDMNNDTLGKWFNVEPITPELESELLNDGIEVSELAALKEQNSVYCREANIFFPPAGDLSHTCGARCDGNENFDASIRCHSCMVWVSNGGFISAIQMDDDGAYTAVKYHRL